ncbi:MAG: SPFH domain-containing protein [Bacteroidales bacterium]|nr:SPFH domain-containing protein [Bacteroidales bacterium]
MGLFSKSEPQKEKVSIVKWNDVNTVALNSFNTDGIEFSNSVKMTVEANQAAFFATRNGIIKTFNEGSHPISTNDIKKIQDGNVTVYFITTQTIPIVRWHTGNVRLKGGEYEISGTYSFQITDVQAFMDNIVLASDVVMSETNLFKKIEIFINENICKAIYESPNKVEDFIGNSQSLQEICFKNIQDAYPKAE